MLSQVIVSVQQDGQRYRWAVSEPGRIGRTSTESFADDFAAALVAASVAKCKRGYLRVTPDMRDRLEFYWTNRGEALYVIGEPETACSNQFERDGWNMAAAAMAGGVD